MPFSTACNTPLSNFESGQNYQDVVDPAGRYKVLIDGQYLTETNVVQRMKLDPTQIKFMLNNYELSTDVQLTFYSKFFFNLSYLTFYQII